MVAAQELLPFHTLERNLILRAGAGTGKTHTLVTLALHLLAGANARRTPVAPSKLVALTFTEKAGAELRERLQQRIGALAEGAPLAEVEPQLADTFRLLGAAAPSGEAWHRLRRDLSLASVGTFHSFCASQLRRLAPAAGIDPGFVVLEEQEARALFDEALDGHVHDALAANDANVSALVDELGLFGDSSLFNLARAVLERLAEDGRDAATLLDDRFDAGRSLAELARAAHAFSEAVSGLSALPAKTLAKMGTALADLAELAVSLTAENAESRLERAYAIRKGFRRPSGDAGRPVAVLDQAIDELQSALAAVRAVPLGRAFIELVANVEARYRDAKSAREALDFSDLQRKLRDLLRDNAAARREVKERIEALLIDEFQDTSRLQLELVALLAESRQTEAPLPSGGFVSAVRWEPGLLCAVGDRKQSIYEFRGADVAVFSGLETALSGPNAAAPARIEHLSRSYRSRPRLVQFVNELFRRAMPTASEPFEVAFGSGDALEAAEADPEPVATEPLVELIESVGESAAARLEDEATKVAARIDRLLRGSDEDVRVRRGATLARPEGRDIALLFRRLTNLDVYRRALDARGLAHVVVGGGGFYESLEVLDGWSLLEALNDPGNPVASLALLRSPFCSLSDPTLARLALVDGGSRLAPVTLARLLRVVPEIPDEERCRLEALLSLVRQLRPEIDRLGLARAYQRALDELDYLAVCAVLDDRESIAANTSKLRDLLEALDESSTTARGALAELSARIEDGRREPGAAVAEEADPRSIRLMSIHQAKGLEFPVVFVVDCGSREPVDNARVAYDRDEGLALNVRLANGKLAGMPELARVREKRKARTQAESLRLFYVAATRARDYLVFSGAPAPGSWFDQVAQLGPQWRRVAVVLSAPIEAPPPAVCEAPEPAPSPAARPLPIVTITGTVTRLQDFAQCPERYRLRHEIGLFEHPPAEPALDDEDSVDAPMEVFARGSLAHRLLELADFPDDSGSALASRLDAILRAEGHDPKTPEIKNIRDDAEAFLGTPFARALAALPASRRLRELPFLLSLDLGAGRTLHVKGQVDLVAISAEAVRIVDYKHSHARPDAAETYRFQLASYAVAVRELLDHTPLPIEVGLAFLRDRGREPRLDSLTGSALDGHGEKMREIGRALVEAYANNRWPRRDRNACDEIGCGYRSRCFPGRRAGREAGEPEARC